MLNIIIIISYVRISVFIYSMCILLTKQIHVNPTGEVYTFQTLGTFHTSWLGTFHTRANKNHS